jgi:hypothetical protein
VQGDPLGGVDVHDHRLPHPIVIDVEHRVARARAAHQVTGAQDRDRALEPAGVEPGRRAQDVLRQRRHRQARDLEHRERRRLELGDAGPDRLVEPELPDRMDLGVAVGGGVADQLADEQRVTAGLVDDPRGLRPVLGREPVEQHAGQRGRLAGIQRLDVNAAQLARQRR